MNRQNGPSGNFSDADSNGGYNYENDRGSRGSGARRPRSATPPASSVADGPIDERNAQPTMAIDAWSLLRPAARRWYWLIFGGVLGALAGAVFGKLNWKTSYAATAQLVHYESPVASDAYVPPKLNGPTLVGMIQSPEIMKNIAARLAAQGKGLAGQVSAVPERLSEIVTIRASGPDAASAIELANLYNAEVIAFTREYQRKEAEEADAYVNAELVTTEKQIAEALRNAPTNTEVSILAERPGAAGPAPVSNARLVKMTEELEAARDKLDELQRAYMDIHPLVKRQREVVSDLEARLKLRLESAPATSTAAAATAGATVAPVRSTGSKIDWDIASYNLTRLNNYLSLMEARKRQIQVFRANPPGNFKVLQAASSETVYRDTPWLKIGLLATLCCMLGIVCAGAELLRREVMDTRLKTEADVARVTGLPVIAHLGDLKQMSLATREAWAFRAWVALQDRLAPSPNHGLICGITSSSSGDGRSTWIKLLAGAARKCGFRVLTISTTAAEVATSGVTTPAAPAAANVVEPVAEEIPEPVPVGPDGEEIESDEPVVKRARAASSAVRRNGSLGGSVIVSAPGDLANRTTATEADLNAIAANGLFSPAVLTEKLMGSESGAEVSIPLPGWTWNLEGRKQWQNAINVWRKLDNVVILVELPPASTSETALLSSNLPNLIWLVEANKSEAADTRAQLETLRHARANIVGAVINKAMTPVAGGRLSRWISCIALFATLGLGLGTAPTPASAAEEAAGGASNLSSFSVVSPQQRAAWQKKLTLGPGDVLTLSLYGEPELIREEIAIGPDGRISYLEAHDIVASGLTVDEFRDKLNDELSKFRRTPQAFVMPVAYKSKKYFVLGRVMQRGPFPLDRPTTLIEAVARAGGLETGLASDRSLVELADLRRAFIARNGERLKVDFEKLFAQGDLSQNVALEPNDYIYFPGGGEREVFVLGAVRSPGPHTFSTSTGVIGAISARGGFSDRAWTKRVLVVRGGLGAPETFKVDAGDVLNGRAPDVVLQPKDIVYVSDRPWIYAEELLDAATNAFVTSAVVVFTSDRITREPR